VKSRTAPNLESFVRTALNNASYHTDDEKILYMTAILDALFRSVTSDSAWQNI